MKQECEGSGNSALAGLDMVKCAQEASGFSWFWTGVIVTSIGFIAVIYMMQRNR
ncbi:hypothetical protein PhaeoP36_03892 (plasmid) [Phaeobacter piscinae]|uniref:Uncharacterized protein n=1 Tax=Phaeobacter piscinae TaxID=1580596 RepID=A0ABN5DM31_9RHOB|nr:hypothetical protein PhaeoP36_03892 [Phaeobacter piscinae]AUQ88489.1 hypothetical protein PhaeoP42_03893 [Phaeobacter piscinae]